MRTVKNILFATLAVFAIMALYLGILMLVNGPLEAFPTEGQIEEMRICGWLFIIVGIVLVSVSAIVLYKNNKKKF